MNRIRSDTFRAVTVLALHAAVLVVLVATPLHDSIDEESVKGFVQRTGWYGPAVLLVLCGVTPLAMMPRWPLAMAGGVLYGTLLGGVLANVGSAAGAVVGFLFARYMARMFIVRRLGRHRDAFDRITDRYGVRILIALRAIPFTSNPMTNALAGVSKMRLWPYAAASFVGMIPSSFMYAFMGKVAKKPDRGLLLLFGVVFVVFSVATLTLGQRLMRRFSVRTDEDETGSAGS